VSLGRVSFEGGESSFGVNREESGDEARCLLSVKEGSVERPDLQMYRWNVVPELLENIIISV
jgi:hypothetical protein